jgi:3D (Asp-Asp-Asp) domain-containing protein
MKCELSDFIKNLILCSFILVSVFFSLSSTHVFGKKIIPQTKIARQLEPNQNFVNKSFNTALNQFSRTIRYETGKQVTLVCDGIEKTFMTCDKTVKALLVRENIVLSKEDSISLSLNDVFEESDLIRIKRVRYKTYNYDEPIPFQTVSGTNSLVANGVKVVWQPGEPGTTRFRIKERYEDGILKEKKIITKTRSKEPISEIIAYGTGFFNGSYKKKFRMCASSYNPTVEQNGPNPFGTATGIRVRYGIVAVDPRVIKLGSHLWVSGYGYALAADTGGLIKNMKIDLFFWRRLPNENWKGGYIDVYLLD